MVSDSSILDCDLSKVRPLSIRNFQMLIGGFWCNGGNNRFIECVDPYVQRIWARVPIATTSDVRAAVYAARTAFQSGPWAEMLPAGRARLLRRLGELIESNAEKLARIQVLENGKPLREVAAQTKGLASHCYYFAGVAELIHGHTVSLSIPEMVNYTMREPIGVVAAVTPWNSPLSLLLWKLCPALAAGNVVIVKPSEISPVSTLVLAELFEKAGFPGGVLNVITGDAQVGVELVNDTGIDKIAFTGSTQAGKSVAVAAAQRLARVSLELGGKSPNIVFRDADLSKAVNGVLAGIFAAGGQTCVAGSRALVDATVMADFSDAVVKKAQKIRLGDPFDMGTEMGPMSCRMQYDKVMHYIEIGKSEGAKLLCGGGHPLEPTLRQGLFVEPTIFGNVRNHMRIAKEEVFGPVLCIIPFVDEDDAVRIANDSRFGLAAGVWTDDVRRAHRMSRRLHAGTVWVNTFRRTNYAMPFGGIKESGWGRENGFEAVNEYTEIKSVWIDTGNGIKDPFNPRA